MVCNRCVMVVENEMKKLGLKIKSVKMGEILLDQPATPQIKEQINNAITPMGFEIIDDKKSRTIEKIKNIIIDLVQNHNGQLPTNLSDHLKSELNLDYNYLSNLFSEIEGTTIERYFIAQKIEKVKELLVYDELTLSEISYRLNYSSVAYLSNQFKKVTGLTPTHFRKIGRDKRKFLDEV